MEVSSLPYVCIMETGGAKQYFCGKCKIQFATPSTIRRHALEHHTDYKEKCPICKEEFKSTIKKQNHLIKIHNVEEVGGKTKRLKKIPKLFCDICKRQFKAKRGFLSHISNSHTLAKCPDCPSMFTGKEMPFHRNDVHGTPIPSCGICGYKNSQQHRVIAHQRQVHLKEKTVSCKICKVTFFDSKFLRNHMISHKPEKLHECSFCHKKFPRKNTLRMHEKIHKGEKNKVCALCGERFVQKASLNYHMVKHHPDAC